MTGGSELNAMLEEVPREYYEYQLRSQDAKMTLKQDMCFYASKDGNEDDLVTLPAGTKIDIARYYPEGTWIQIVYDQDTKTVWLRRDEPDMILPTNVHEGEMSEHYIDRLYLAG